MSRRVGAALAAALALAGCTNDPVATLTVRNDTDRVLAALVEALPALRLAGPPQDVIDPGEPTLLAAGLLVLDPGEAASLDHPAPGDGVGVTVWVDRELDGTFAFSGVEEFPEDDLRDADGRIRLVSYRRPG